MAKFKTLEEAQKAFDDLVVESKSKTAEAVKKAQEAKDRTIATHKEANSKLKDENIDLKKQLQEATDVAKDAINQVNAPKENTVKVKHGGKQYKVNFGVDGKTIDEVAKDPDLLKRLVDIQSGALTE